VLAAPASSRLGGFIRFFRLALGLGDLFRLALGFLRLLRLGHLLGGWLGLGSFFWLFRFGHLSRLGLGGFLRLGLLGGLAKLDELGRDVGMGSGGMLDLSPVAGGAFFLHGIALGQAADDAETLAAPGTDVEFLGGHFALLDEAQVHPCLAGGRHGDLEPVGRLAFARRGDGHLGEDGHLVALAELGHAFADQAGPGADVDAVAGDDARLGGGDFADDVLCIQA